MESVSKQTAATSNKRKDTTPPQREDKRQVINRDFKKTKLKKVSKVSTCLFTPENIQHLSFTDFKADCEVVERESISKHSIDNNIDNREIEIDKMAGSKEGLDTKIMKALTTVLQQDWVKQSMLETVIEHTRQLSEEVVSLKKTVEEYREEIDNLKKNNELREQKDRNKTLRFCGIKEATNREKVIDTIGEFVSDKLQVGIQKDNIESCYRVGKLPEPGHAGKPRDIVIAFTTYSMKESVYTARTKLRKLEKNAGGSVFINEQLKKDQISLFTETRKRIDREKGQSAWTFNGNVYIKLDKEKESPSIRIENMVKLGEVFKKEG